jgi:hypothetical protein
VRIAPPADPRYHVRMRNDFRRLAAAASIVFAGALLAQCSRTPEQGAVATDGVPFKPVATVDEVMDAIIIPSSQAIFDAVVYSNGELTAAPETDEDWANLRIHALGVAEAANLLMLPPRAKDSGDWMTMTIALNESAVTVAKAAEAKDLDGLLKTGGEMYNACTQCHEKYIMAAEGQ